LLIIESADERTVSLPWELLRLQGRYAVQDGALDVTRCVLAPGALQLARPTTPVTLMVTIAAPEQSGLDYEAESYSITRALHDHVGVIVNDMGELDDLVTGLRGEPPPLGVHFCGHGGRGQLVFEDEFGGARYSSAVLKSAKRRGSRFAGSNLSLRGLGDYPRRCIVGTLLHGAGPSTPILPQSGASDQRGVKILQTLC
jgi:hypothetical protein